MGKTRLSCITPKRMERLRDIWRGNFDERGEIGAAVAVYRHDELVIDLFGGHADARKTRPWREQTPVLIWSATKGPAAACLLHGMQEEGIVPDQTIASFWPEFAAEGKAGITLGQLLAHQSGLSAVKGGTMAVEDHEAVVTALAGQPPLWKPGEGTGYHAHTFGPLLDECLRRITGGEFTLAQYWENKFRVPFELDLWIGLPPEQMDEVADILPPKFPATDQPEQPFYKALATPGSWTRQAFEHPKAHRPRQMNQPELRQAVNASFGGIGTARALAKFYALCISEGGPFTAKTRRWMESPVVQARDRVLCEEVAFSAGFMLDPVDHATGRKTRELFGPNQRAFGQPGAGGSLAFADPSSGVAFAYVMNQMEFGVLPNAKSLDLVKAIYAGEERAL